MRGTVTDREREKGVMIEVKREPEQPEQCCFCREPTPFWFTENDVACCQRCAKFANAKDVPTKAVWLRRERIAGGMVYNPVTRNHEQARVS